MGRFIFQQENYSKSQVPSTTRHPFLHVACYAAGQDTVQITKWKDNLKKGLVIPVFLQVKKMYGLLYIASSTSLIWILFGWWYGFFFVFVFFLGMALMQAQTVKVSHRRLAQVHFATFPPQGGPILVRGLLWSHSFKLPSKIWRGKTYRGTHLASY